MIDIKEHLSISTVIPYSKYVPCKQNFTFLLNPPNFGTTEVLSYEF